MGYRRRRDPPPPKGGWWVVPRFGNLPNPKEYGPMTYDEAGKFLTQMKDRRADYRLEWRENKE